MLKRLLLRAAAVAAVAAGEVPVLSNTCWDNDPGTHCPVSQRANDRYVQLAMEGGLQPPAGLRRDDSCRVAERADDANASRCLEALRERMAVDEEEVKNVRCNETAALMHTWWDGPLVRVVALFLRSFRKTQHPECAKLVVWTPRQGSERATPESFALVKQVEALEGGAPVVFMELRVTEMARGTLFEDFVQRTIAPHAWDGTENTKREGASHFSDFFQLFVLWRYGGIYFDADMILLRDLYPLWGLNFEYQWSFIPQKLNNAVQGLTKKSSDAERLVVHGAKLRGTACCKGWGATLWRASVLKAANTYSLPCTAFDPYWLRMDGHVTGESRRPSLPYPPHSDRFWLFRAPHAHGDWFRGAFAIHWHGGAGGPHGGDVNVWKPSFLPGSYADYWESELFA